MEHLRVRRRRCAQRLEWRESAVRDEHLELAAVLAMREDADVTAVADRHPGRDRGAHARALLREAWRLRRAGFPASVPAHCFARCDRRTEDGAVLLHKAEDFRRARVAV